MAERWQQLSVVQQAERQATVTHDLRPEVLLALGQLQ